MRVAIIYNDPGEGNVAALDVLIQRDAVMQALTGAGHHCVPIACTLDLESLRGALRTTPVDCVFNLVEALEGTDRLAPLVPLLLDVMGIRYTGCSASTLLRTADKIAVKESLRERGLPTPEWHDVRGARSTPAGRYIVKPRFEHASVGIDDASIIDIDCIPDLMTFVQSKQAQTGLRMFAERYIDGREFNIAMLESVDGDAAVLPPAEIDFSAFPEGKPRIVGYDAKWSEASFEYGATPRRFAFPDSDRPLLEELIDLAQSVWSTFRLNGYARVDMRVDSKGRPWVLEVNANPCLSPDAGFAAALDECGMGYPGGIERILAVACRDR